MPTYAVCPRCSFLRAFSEGVTPRPGSACPSCGAVLLLEDGTSRFPPAYLSAAAQEIHLSELRRSQWPRRRVHG